METKIPMDCLADVKRWARGALEAHRRERLDRDMAANFIADYLSGQGLVTGETWEDHEHIIPHRGWVLWIENGGRLRLRHCVAYVQSNDGTKVACVMAVRSR